MEGVKKRKILQARSMRRSKREEGDLPLSSPSPEVDVLIAYILV